MTVNHVENRRSAEKQAQVKAEVARQAQVADRTRSFQQAMVSQAPSPSTAKSQNATLNQKTVAQAGESQAAVSVDDSPLQARRIAAESVVTSSRRVTSQPATQAQAATVAMRSAKKADAPAQVLTVQAAKGDSLKAMKQAVARSASGKPIQQTRATRQASAPDMMPTAVGDEAVVLTTTGQASTAAAPETAKQTSTAADVAAAQTAASKAADSIVKATARAAANTSATNSDAALEGLAKKAARNAAATQVAPRQAATDRPEALSAKIADAQARAVDAILKPDARSESTDPGQGPQFDPVSAAYQVMGMTPLAGPAIAVAPQAAAQLSAMNPAVLQQIVEFAAVTKDREGRDEFRLGLGRSALGGGTVCLTRCGSRRVSLKFTGGHGPEAVGEAEINALVELLRQRNIEVIDLEMA